MLRAGSSPAAPTTDKICLDYGKDEKVGSRHIGPDILKYLEERIRLNVHRGDIAKDLNLQEKQVTNAVYNMIRRGVPVIKVMDGVWRYDPSMRVEAKVNDNHHGATQMLFEMIGQSKQGKFVLQDESGDLYVAERL